MTDKQKQAITILNRVCYSIEAISEEEYFTLLEFILGDKVKEIFPTYPQKQDWETPIMVMYGCRTDGITFIETTTDHKEEE